MVFSSTDPTDVAIQKIVYASRKIISPLNNPVVNRHLELKISTLQNSPRDLAALEALMLGKEKQKNQSQTVIET
jgi:hypothetical protein